MLKRGLEKKGISAVITTLIIILLVLVAAGILWVVLRGFISEGTDSIGVGQFTLSMSITGLEVEEGEIKVKVMRNVGQGEMNAIKFIFSDGENTKVIDKEAEMNELDERTFTVPLSELGEEFGFLREVSIAPVILSQSGKETVGNIADSQTFDLEIEAIGTAFYQRNAAGGHMPRILNIGTKEIYNQPAARGLRFTIISKDNLEVTHDQTYDVYGATSNSDDLSTDITSMMNEGSIGVLTSVDAWAVKGTNLKGALESCGLLKAAEFIVGRNPYAAVFDCSEGRAIEDIEKDEAGLGITGTLNCEQTTCIFGEVKTTSFT